MYGNSKSQFDYATGPEKSSLPVKATFAICELVITVAKEVST